jgi:ribonuclease Z
LLSWPGRFPKGFQLVELKDGRNRVAGETVDVQGQPHSDPSTAIRVRDVVYVTDTTARPETAVFAKDAAVLVHDAWLDSEDQAAGHDDLRTHATAAGAAMVAKDAGVRTLVLSHLNPRYDEARLERLRFEAAKIYPQAHLADDFAVHDIHGREAEEGEAAAPAPTPEVVTAGDEGD